MIAVHPLPFFYCSECTPTCKCSIQISYCSQVRPVDPCMFIYIIAKSYKLFKVCRNAPIHATKLMKKHLYHIAKQETQYLLNKEN